MEVQQAVSDLDRFETVLEWAKSQATMRGRPRVAARCDDLTEIALLEKNLLVRQSPFAQPIGRATQQTIQQGIQELQHRAGDPDVQDALQQGQQVVDSIGQAMGRAQVWGQQGTQQEGSQQQGVQQHDSQQGLQQPYQG
jgi:hypothetical protein